MQRWFKAKPPRVVLGFITHNFSNEKGERVNVLKKVEAHYTQKISYSYFLPSWEINGKIAHKMIHAIISKAQPVKKGLVNRKF